MESEHSGLLRRYCDIPSLVHLLSHKSITLVSPGSWEDLNDSAFMAEYQRRKALKSLLALCFTKSGETFHHWKVFGGGSGGVCITFKREPLVNRVLEQPGVTVGDVNYLKLPELRAAVKSVGEVETQKLPFIKRVGFMDEAEVRVVYESESKAQTYIPIEISIGMIQRVTLSPWLNAALVKSTKEMLHLIPGCKTLQVSKSTLISNEEWQSLATKLKK